jgi:hypothetical protein
MKGLGSRGLEAEEENMRLLTRRELAHLSKFDLEALLGLALLEVSYAKQESPEWHRAMASLVNIRQELAAHKMTPRPRGPGL